MFSMSRVHVGAIPSIAARPKRCLKEQEITRPGQAAGARPRQHCATSTPFAASLVCEALQLDVI